MARVFLLLLLLLCSVSLVGAVRVKHFVVVMLENRSFDHMFGAHANVNGLNPQNNWNPINSSDPTKGRVQVGPAAYISPCDPDHSTAGTTMKIFGSSQSAESMMGFYEEEVSRGRKNGCDVMSAFNASAELPVHSFLADNFALFDEWFCSYPGPTWPNRWFTLMGTSAGDTETGGWFMGKTGLLYPHRTIFDQVEDAGLTSQYVYGNTPWELNIASILHHPERMIQRDQFLANARSGKMPNFAWLTPRSGVSADGIGADDCHPDHAVQVGERYLKDVYDSLRSSPAWNETVLVVTYDEHGGFYDHVAPPTGVPDPTLPSERTPYGPPGYPSPFTRLGVRVPTLVISPLIPKATIVGAPPASQKPFTTSAYEHTSIMATVRKMLGVREGNLTARDGWSATFEHIFALREPRETPLRAPAPPPLPPNALLEEMNAKVNDLQHFILKTHATLSGIKMPYPERQAHVNAALHAHFNQIVAQVHATDAQFNILVRAEPFSGPFPKSIVADEWEIVGNRIRTLNMLDKSVRCFTRQGATGIIPALCRNASVDQDFLLVQDGTLRPIHQQQLCVTVEETKASDTFLGCRTIFLAPCKPSNVQQAFGIYSPNVAGGEDDNPNLFWGDSIGYVTVSSSCD